MKSAARVREGRLKSQRNKEGQAVIVSIGIDQQKLKDVALVALLKDCAKKKDLHKASIFHADILKRGLLKRNPFVGSTLVNLYAKCGALAKAQEVFNELSVRDKVSWTALIAGYAQHGYGEEALNCFECMQSEGLSPDPSVFACLLKACGIIGATEKGDELHAEISREGLLGSNTVLGNALVDMYAKCGALGKAQHVFDKLPARDVVSWNALIAGYSQHRHGEEALYCFEQMRGEGLSPDAVTFLCILNACGSIGMVERGKEIHSEIVREGLLGKFLVIGNALVNMYAKCGALAQAQQVFEELPIRDVITWNALIAGYSQCGHGEEALNCFERMQHDGLSPNEVTFLCILSVCSYSGLLEEGQMYFDIMSAKHGITPTLEHQTCMVVLYGRGGFFDKAMGVINKVPSSDCLPLWVALLGACRIWGNVKLGRLAFEHVIRLDEKSALAYVYMGYIYVAAGMQEDADKIEAMRMRHDAWKVPARCWWTDVSGNVHSFCVQDKGHLQIKSICAKLEGIGLKLSQEGYCPDLLFGVTRCFQ